MFPEALPLIKARLGISTTIRDTYLNAIIDGLVTELKDVQGLTLVADNKAHLMFVVDYAEYRYSNRENPTLPRHLQFRLHNLIISGGGASSV